MEIRIMGQQGKYRVYDESGKSIAQFEHEEKDGLAMCLNKASLAVWDNAMTEAVQRED